MNTYEIKLTGQTKRFDDWREDLTKYLQVGDAVDEKMKNYFIDVLPPVTMRSTLIQIGEPAFHIAGKPTYATITKIDGAWIYAGECFRNEIKNMSFD